MIAAVRQAFRDMRAGREARSTLANPDSWLLAALGSGATKSGATVGEGTAFNVPTVAACVNILAQSIAMLPLKVYRRTATGAEEATDHRLSYLLKRKPGSAQTSYQWRAWMQTCLGLGGNVDRGEGQQEVHDGQDAVDDQFHISHEGGAAHCHHVAELFEFQFLQGTDLCIVQLRALGCVFAHIRSSYQAIV